MRRLEFIGLAATLLLLTSSPGVAQERPETEQPVQSHPEGDEAIARLKSPYCPGMMLEVCPSTPARYLRDSIQTLAWEGVSADSIVAWMVGRHGEEYRAVPLTRGSGLWAWAMPPFAFIMGLVLVTAVLRRLRAGHAQPPQPAGPLSDADEATLTEAMEELRASEEVPF